MLPGKAPYGWLAWFLAPMQDGKFLHNGDIIPLRRAVYFFAGGTAATTQQFSDFSQLSEFQRARYLTSSVVCAAFSMCADPMKSRIGCCGGQSSFALS